MYSCTHTHHRPRVCTVYRSPRVHTKTTVSAIGLLYFLPLSSLFLFPSFYIYIYTAFNPSLSLSLAFDLAYLVNAGEAPAFFVTSEKMHAASRRMHGTHPIGRYMYISDRASPRKRSVCSAGGVGSRDRSATVVPPPSPSFPSALNPRPRARGADAIQRDRGDGTVLCLLPRFFFPQ